MAPSVNELQIQQGIPQDKAKEVVRFIKDSKAKVQASIQGDVVRVSGKDRDTLQTVIAGLKGKDFGINMQFSNYRYKLRTVSTKMHATEPSAVLEDVKLTAKRIFSVISAELGQVETEFERQARSNVQVIDYLGDYLSESGGKRVRPALTILSNYAVGGDGSRYNSIRMATVMEFLHTATLVHDDIIDNVEHSPKSANR